MAVGLPPPEFVLNLLRKLGLLPEETSQRQMGSPVTPPTPAPQIPQAPQAPRAPQAPTEPHQLSPADYATWEAALKPAREKEREPYLTPAVPSAPMEPHELPSADFALWEAALDIAKTETKIKAPFQAPATKKIPVKKTAAVMPKGVSFATLPHTDIAAEVTKAQRKGLPIYVNLPEGQYSLLAQVPPGEYGAGGLMETEKGLWFLPETREELYPPQQRVPVPGVHGKWGQEALAPREALQLRGQALAERGMGRREPISPLDCRTLIEKIKANPVAAMSALETAIRQKGLTGTSIAQAHRRNLGNMMAEAGIDPGAAMMYGQEGITPDVARYISGQAERRAGVTAREDLVRLQAGLRGEPAGPSATLTETARERLFKSFTRQKKKYAIAYEVNQIPILYERKGLIKKWVPVKDPASILKKIVDEVIPKEDVGVLQMRSRGTPGGKLPSAPKAPTSVVTGDEYSSIFKKLTGI